MCVLSSWGRGQWRKWGLESSPKKPITEWSNRRVQQPSSTTIERQFCVNQNRAYFHRTPFVATPFCQIWNRFSFVMPTLIFFCANVCHHRDTNRNQCTNVILLFMGIFFSLSLLFCRIRNANIHSRFHTLDMCKFVIAKTEIMPDNKQHIIYNTRANWSIRSGTSILQLTTLTMSFMYR